MGKFVTRGNIDKMTRQEAEAAANQELQQKIGGRGQASADETVESQLAVPAWARESAGEGLLARLARQRSQAAVERDDDGELEPAPTRRRSTRATPAKRAASPRRAATGAGATKSTKAKAVKAVKATRAPKAVKATRAPKAAGLTKTTRTARATKASVATKATKASKAAAKRRRR